MCAPGTIVTGVTLVVGPSDLALPSVAINRMTFHCGVRHQGPVVPAAPGGGSTGGASPPPPPTDERAAGADEPRSASAASPAGTVGAAVGAAVGGAVVLAAVAGLVVMCRRKTRYRAPKADPAGKPTGLSSTTGSSAAVPSCTSTNASHLAGAEAGSTSTSLPEGGTRPMIALPSQSVQLQLPDLEAPSIPSSLISKPSTLCALTSAGGHSVQLGRMLASGATAWVYQGTCSTHGQVAVKLWVPQDHGQQGDGWQGCMQREVSLLTTHLAHPFLVRGLWAHQPAVHKPALAQSVEPPLRPSSLPADKAAEITPIPATLLSQAAVSADAAAGKQESGPLSATPDSSQWLSSAVLQLSQPSSRPVSGPTIQPNCQHRQQLERQGQQAAASSYVVMELGQQTLAQALHGDNAPCLHDRVTVRGLVCVQSCQLVQACTHPLIGLAVLADQGALAAWLVWCAHTACTI
jgi:hypothetical protein